MDGRIAELILDVELSQRLTAEGYTKLLTIVAELINRINKLESK